MMSSTPPEIENPARFVTQHVVAFDDGTGRAKTVGATVPLPVEIRTSAAAVALTGILAPGKSLIGPFAAVPGRAVWVSLEGSFTGTVRTLRSVDGGVTKLGLTVAGQSWAVFTAAGNEPVAEESGAGATYYLSCDIAVGAPAYRIGQ